MAYRPRAMVSWATSLEMLRMMAMPAWGGLQTVLKEEKATTWRWILTHHTSQSCLPRKEGGVVESLAGLDTVRSRTPAFSQKQFTRSGFNWTCCSSLMIRIYRPWGFHLWCVAPLRSPHWYLLRRTCASRSLHFCLPLPLRRFMWHQHQCGTLSGYELQRRNSTTAWMYHPWALGQHSTLATHVAPTSHLQAGTKCQPLYAKAIPQSHPR